MMATAIGTIAADGSITNTTLWMYDDNSEHAHRIVYEGAGIGNAATGKTFCTKTGLTHKVTTNTSTTAYNVIVNSSIDATKAIQATVTTTQFVHGQ